MCGLYNFNYLNLSMNKLVLSKAAYTINKPQDRNMSKKQRNSEPIKHVSTELDFDSERQWSEAANTAK